MPCQVPQSPYYFPGSFPLSGGENLDGSCSELIADLLPQTMVAAASRAFHVKVWLLFTGAI